MDLETATPMTNPGYAEPESVAIVCDDPTFRRQTRALLEEAGYSVVEHETGQSAVRGNGHVLATACVDLALRDISGLDVLARLHERDPDLALIALAAESEPHLLARATQAGAYDCVTTPLQAQRLLSAARRASERGRLLRRIQELETELGKRKLLDAVSGQRTGSIPRREQIVPLREVERCAIEAALRTTGGSVGKAAKLLGIGRATLYRRLAAGAVVRRQPSTAPAGFGVSQSAPPGL